MKNNLAKNQSIDSEQSVLNDIHLAWLKEDTAAFSILIPRAMGLGLNKHQIIDYLEGKRNKHLDIDEEFETWAYNYIVSGGMGKLRPG